MFTELPEMGTGPDQAPPAEGVPFNKENKSRVGCPTRFELHKSTVVSSPESLAGSRTTSTLNRFELSQGRSMVVAK